MTLKRALVVPFVLLAASGPASAHFKLDAPLTIANQDSLGDPQKTEPCGQDDGNPAFVLTNDVNTMKTGSMVTITITQTIFHPGHFRAALAQDMASLPADPVITPTSSDPCASTVVEANPTLPILGDGLLEHSTSFGSTPQSVQVQLPAGMTCTNCVMQVIEFMSSHGAPCFYHHCAAVTISDSAPPPPDGGVTPGDDAGTVDPGNSSNGGCCSSHRGAPSAAFLGLLVLGLVLRRR